MKMKLGWCVIVLGIWVAWIFFTKNEPTLDVASKRPPPPPPPPPPTIMTFDLDTENYATFLEQVRGHVMHPTRSYYGKPMMNSPTNPPNYILLELVSSHRGVQVTIQLSKDDLYVVGYLDQYNGRPRCHYFPDYNRKDDVFPNLPADQRQQTKCKSSYQSLEAESHKKRETLQLSLGIWGDYMKNVYGKDSQPKAFGKNQATFLLMCVEMISEATRFKYIELKADGSFPDYKVRSLVNAWDPLSKQIIESKNGVFQRSVKLKNKDNKEYTVTKVSEVQMDISILKYEP